jgi:pimeloyl-ACP methyl ester carboxylesterase
MTARFACLSFFALLLLGTSVQALGPKTSGVIVTDLSYVTPARVVDIGEGRKMNILCVGEGAPTVVFEAGLADQVSTWATVQPNIAHRTRTCSYDRAGFGFSDPVDRPVTSANVVDDLHRLLTAASIRPPYVLVGHSLGGLYVRLYAANHRSDVVGMILVDPTSEDQGRRYFALDPSMKIANERYVESRRQECIPMAARGFDKASEAYERCIGGPDPRFSTAFNDALAASRSNEAYFRAEWSEWVNTFTTSSDQVRTARRNFGDMPLIVLTRAPYQKQSNESQEMRDAKNRLWMELHDDLARLSTRGVNRVVPNAGHNIQLDQPAAVVDAIFEVLQEIAGSRGASE